MRTVPKSVIRKQEENDSKKIWVDREISEELIMEGLKIHEIGSGIIKVKEALLIWLEKMLDTTNDGLIQALLV